MKTKTVTVVSTALGILLVILAIYYWATPAGSLPSFFPGYAVGSSVVHIKHGIASFVLGLLFFALAWFKSGKKSMPTA